MMSLSFSGTPPPRRRNRKAIQSSHESHPIHLLPICTREEYFDENFAQSPHTPCQGGSRRGGPLGGMHVAAQGMLEKARALAGEMS